MSIVRCDRCELPIDTDLEDTIELADGKGEAHFNCVEKEVCPECEEHRPEDERVKAGMKCGFCAYSTERKTTK